MFLIRLPSSTEIDRFLDHSVQLPLSYGPTGIVRNGSGAGRLDEQVVTIGNRAAAFERARLALTAWKHFNIGWVQVFRREASTKHWDRRRRTDQTLRFLFSSNELNRLSLCVQRTTI